MKKKAVIVSSQVRMINSVFAVSDKVSVFDDEIVEIDALKDTFQLVINR